MTEEDVRAALKKWIAAYPTGEAAAQALGIARSFLLDQRDGRRGLSDQVLARLGFERVTIIRRRKEKVG